MENFIIIKPDENTAARTGVLRTAHGEIETPVFVPAGLQSVSRLTSASEMKFWGAQAVSASFYHLNLKPGESAMRRTGGLHSFLNWPGTVFCDGGGEIFSNPGNVFLSASDAPKNITAIEGGIAFQMGADSAVRELKPKAVIQAQINLGADVLQTLYFFPKKSTSAKAAAWFKIVFSWFERSRRQYEKSPATGRPLFFAVLPAALPEKSSVEALRSYQKSGIDGFAITGWPTKLFSKKNRQKFGSLAKNFPQDLPRQAIGLADPSDMVSAVSYGFDLFDSLAPNRLAESGQVLVASRGKAGYWNLDLSASGNRGLEAPIDTACECFACSKSSRGEIYELLAREDSTGKRLTLMHNLRFFLKLFEQIRRSITYGSFEGFASEFRQVKPE